MAERESKRRKWLVVALLTVPLWLLISGGIGIWLHFKHEAEKAREEVARFATEVSRPALETDLKTLAMTIGERNPKVASGLTQTAAWIEGTLGPSNAGYPVTRVPGPGGAAGNWPLLRVTVRGSKEDAEAVWVVSAYDSPANSRGVEAAATAVVAQMAAAQALANEKPSRTVHFLFIPHGNEVGDRAAATFAKVQQVIRAEGNPGSLLCLDAMGAGEELWVSARNTESPVLPAVGNLGKIVGAEVICFNDANDISSELFALGLPAVRVGTRAPVAPDETDDELPAGEGFTAATGRVVELIRRVSALP